MNGTSLLPGRKRPRESELLPEYTENDGLEDSSSNTLNAVRNDHEHTETPVDVEQTSQPTTRVVKRNFDKVNFGHWQIKTWYYSPYPLWETEPEDHTIQSTSNRVTASSGSRSVVNIRSLTSASDLFIGNVGQDDTPMENSVLWVCDRCFKYMRDGMSFELHSEKKGCHAKSPPGKKVYQRGAHIIWEVDGAKEKLYCQNLSLFGKLFIDVKTLFFDCDNFLFYILTDADSQRDHVLGFFSKEKVSYDNYNLACIVILPPYQKKGYGMLLIEFSYELSRKTGKLGTPERPLSNLGLRSYLAYWVATLVRFFRHVLAILPSEIPQIVSKQLDPDLSLLVSTDSEDPSLRFKRRKSQAKENGSATPNTQDGEVSLFSGDDAFYNSLRYTRTVNNPDGSVTTHVLIKCTLDDISRATSLRVEDVAFALNESGLLTRARQLNGDEKMEELIIISREMIESVAKERAVKRMCMDVRHVLL